MLSKMKEIYKEGGFSKRILISVIAGTFSAATVAFYCAAASQPVFSTVMGSLGTFTMITGSGVLATFLWMD